MLQFLYWWLSHWHNLLAHILDLIGNVFRGCGLFTAWLPDRRISESAWTAVLPDASDSFWSSCFLGTRICCGSLLLWIFESAIAGVAESVLAITPKTPLSFLIHIFFPTTVYYPELRLVKNENKWKLVPTSCWLACFVQFSQCCKTVDFNVQPSESSKKSRNSLLVVLLYLDKAPLMTQTNKWSDRYLP